MESHDSTAGGSESPHHTMPEYDRDATDIWAASPLLNAVHCGIVIVDGQGIIRLANDPVTTMLGYAREELVGKPLETLIPERFHRRHLGHFSRYSERPYTRRMGMGIDIIARHREGTEVPVEIGLSPLHREGQVYTVATLINITEYKTIEQELSRARNDLRAIINNLPAMIGYWDKDLRNRFGNHAYQDWFGVTPEQMYGRHIREIIGEELFAKNYPYITGALAGETQNFERTITDPTGAVRYSQASYIPDIHDGQVEGFFVLVTDISRRKRAEMALFEEKERIRVTLSSIGDAVITTDNDGCVTYLNPIAEEMTGWTSAQATGHPIEDVMALRDTGTGATLTNPVRLALQENRIVEMGGNCILARRSGEQYHIEDTAAPIRTDAEGTIGAVIVFHDVSEMRALAMRMSHMAQHDALTDLPNRLLLYDRISQVIQFARRNAAQFAILFLDLDNFKQINDSLGHGAGDELLRRVAKRLTRSVDSSSTVSRLGGDEFIILLSHVDSADHAERQARELLAAVSEPFEIGKENICVTFSVGISLYPADGDDSETLIRHADAAMYAAKAAGRNQARFFSRELGAAVQARHRLDRNPSR